MTEAELRAKYPDVDNYMERIREDLELYPELKNFPASVALLYFTIKMRELGVSLPGTAEAVDRLKEQKALDAAGDKEGDKEE